MKAGDQFRERYVKISIVGLFCLTGGYSSYAESICYDHSITFAFTPS
jgi:hypothetical protein